MSTPLFIHEPPAALRGSRDYIHSTDIYDQIAAGAALANFRFEGPVDLRIRAKITCRPRFTFFPAGEPVGDAAVTCTFRSEGMAYISAVTETKDPVLELKSYDESPVERVSRIKDRTARLDGETGLRPIEAVTALAVHLHKTTLPPISTQRWMLGQLSIRRPLRESEASWLILNIEKLVGTSMTRTRIDSQEGPLGTMIFILANG